MQGDVLYYLGNKNRLSNIVLLKFKICSIKLQHSNLFSDYC